MVYLDANALYSYLGREKLPLESSVLKYDLTKLRQFLDLRSGVCIPSSVMMEIIVHFRNNPKSIKCILHFCNSKKIKVYNSNFAEPSASKSPEL